MVTKPRPGDTDVSGFEVERLGLGEEPFVFKVGHVNIVLHRAENGKQLVSIFVNDIEVQGFDPVNKQFAYKITDVNKYVQPWETGGAYLSPDLIPPSKTRVT